MLQWASERGQARAAEAFGQVVASAALRGVALDEQTAARRMGGRGTADVEAAWERYYRNGGDFFLQGAILQGSGLLKEGQSAGWGVEWGVGVPVS